MARGTQFLQLQKMLREEVNRSSSVSVGVDDLPGLKDKLQRTQETLYDEYDWPFLREIFPLKQMQAGVRYYDFPVDAGNLPLNVERVEKVVVWFGNIARPLIRGIGFPQYSVYNSANGVTSDPAIRWDIRWTGSKEQYEIWPMPASTNASQVQFEGIRQLRPLVQDSDVADLDDQMIVLFAAAELLAKQGSQSASVVLKLAQARMNRMKSRVSTDEAYRMGMGDRHHENKVKIVVRAS
jgi:hypothetical protein